MADGRQLAAACWTATYFRVLYDEIERNSHCCGAPDCRLHATGYEWHGPRGLGCAESRNATGLTGSGLGGDRAARGPGEGDRENFRLLECVGVPYGACREPRVRRPSVLHRVLCNEHGFGGSFPKARGGRGRGECLQPEVRDRLDVRVPHAVTAYPVRRRVPGSRAVTRRVGTAAVLMVVVGSCMPPVFARGTVNRLEREARALAVTSGCSDATQCRSAPVGAKSCGGPRYYLPYCPLSTDSVALYRKLAELATAEREYNRKSGMMSNCSVEMPPQLAFDGGQCRAAGR